MSPKFELITHVLCPYVQRSVIVLHEKGVPYRRMDIDLANKPDWFRRISPLGKVPVLVIGEQRSLFESAVICEYLDEVTPGSLHPDDPFDRADHRAWIEFGSGLLNGIAQLYNAPTREAFTATSAMLRERLLQLDERLDNGPYFSGDHFRIIDAVYGPIFRYFDVFDSVMNLEFAKEAGKVQSWRGHLRSRESVRQAVNDDYPERLLAFIENRGSYMSTLAAGVGANAAPARSIV